MTADDLYRRVEARLPDAIEIDGKTFTHEVLAALAERLTPDEAAEHVAELVGQHGEGDLTRDEFIEDIAARLDLDDDDAELGAQAVLGVIREALEPVVAIDQVLESLPSDLAAMMQ